MDAPVEIIMQKSTANCVEIAVELTKLHDVVQQSTVSEAGDGCYDNGNDDVVVLNSCSSDICCSGQPRGA